MGIRLEDLSRLGYRDNAARSLIVDIASRHCRYDTKEQVETTLGDILEHPGSYKNSEVWNKLAERLSPTVIAREFIAYGLLDEPLTYKTYGGKFIETLVKQQMNLVMHLPVTVAGALMPDARTGYELPIGGVLATNSVMIPYIAGVNIGCRMNLTVFDTSADFLKRCIYQMKEALRDFTYSGMNGGLGFEQEHEVLDREEFRLTLLLRNLRGKAARQLGSSSGGNHFVEFGEIALQENNVSNLPEGNYLVLLSHSGSRGLGAAIAKHYSLLTREVCRLPREAQYSAWLDLNTEAGQEYWMSMNLTGDCARTCHEQIHSNLVKALGLKPLVNVNSHHNFAWREEIAPGCVAIVHHKGATPARRGQAGLVPGSMAAAGCLVYGKGMETILNPASHGAGRAMSRQKAKDNFTQSALRKLLSQARVTLISGSAEEMPPAHKDTDRVMYTQEMLVEM